MKTGNVHFNPGGNGIILNVGQPPSTPINYREALKWGLLATVYVVATAVFATFTLASLTLAGFGIAAMTVDMGINAAFAIFLGISSCILSCHCGIKAWDYCKKTHYTLNP